MTFKSNIDRILSKIKSKFNASAPSENHEGSTSTQFVKLKEDFFYYSGLKYIWRKFIPANKDTLPTGFIWLLGIYLALFLIGTQRYDNRIDIIENRANAVFTQISSNTKMALERIPEIQHMRCPIKPNIFNPLSVLQSLYKNDVYEEMIEFLSQLIVDWKESLKGINLSGANLFMANLEDTDLQKTNFSKAALSKVNFSRSNLSEANLSETDLSGAYLNKANLRLANLTKANLNNTDFSLANLKETFLSDANLSGAIFFKANLEKANLSKANLNEATLFETNLKDVDFSMTDLRSARNVTADQLCSSKTLYKTLLDPDIEKKIIKQCPHLLGEDSLHKKNSN